MANKIAFVNNKGGSGKTTTTTNIAGAIHQLNPNKKILIFDVDAQANAGRQFGINANADIDNNKNAYHIFRHEIKPENAVTHTKIENIDMITGGIELNLFEYDEICDAENDGMYNVQAVTHMANDYAREFARKMLLDTINEIKDNDYDIASIDGDNLSTLSSVQLAPHFKEYFNQKNNLKYNNRSNQYFSQINGLIEHIDKQYDFILFDTPPDLHSATNSVMSVADQIIIPFAPDTFSLDGINNIIEQYHWIKDNFNSNLRIGGLLATQYRKRTVLHSSILIALIDFANKNHIPYFTTRIPNSTKIASATSINNVPATLSVNPNHISKVNKPIQSYYDLVHEMEDKKIINLK